MATSQVSFSRDFINNLLNKLKIGNRRGIHLNALPGRYASRLDLKDIDRVLGGLSTDFLERLLTDPIFSFEISFDGIKMDKLDEEDKNALFLLARKLNNMVYENEDQFLEFGIKNFGLGYPLLIRRDANDPTKIVKAPLLIWKLDIQKSGHKANAWLIKRDEDSPVVINELLRNHILNDAQISIDQLTDEVLQDGVVDQEEFARVCHSVLSQLNVKDRTVEDYLPRVEMCPSREKIDQLATEDAWIQWSGIFGLYKSRKESIIKQNETLLEQLSNFQEDKLELESFQTSTISSVNTDPSKEELVNTLTASEIKLIQGPPGTGKSQALTAIITNVLENGGKCLVVCEKKTALDVIYKNLGVLGLSEHVALIDDVNKDRTDVVRSARTRVEGLNSFYDRYDFTGYRSKLERFFKLRDALNKKHSNLLKNIFGEKSWKETVGNFLATQRNAGYRDLKEKLEYSKYKLDSSEFVKTRDIVVDASDLYRSFNYKSLQAIPQLRKEIFEQQYSRALLDDLKNFVEHRRASLSDRLDSINHLENSHVSLGAFKLFDHKGLIESRSQVQQALSLVSEIFTLLGQISILCSRPKEEIVYSTPTQLLGSFLVRKSKNIVQLKRSVLGGIDQYNAIVRQNWKEILPQMVVKSDTRIERFTIQIQENMDLLEDILRKNQDILELSEKLRSSEDKDNKENDLYTQRNIPVVSNFDDLSKYRQELKTELDYHAALEKEMKDFEPLHRWNYFNATLEENYRLIINALRDTPVDEWCNIFSCWYLYGVLTHAEAMVGELNTGDDELRLLVKVYDELKEGQVKKIEALWAKKLVERVEDMGSRGGFNILYNLRKNKAFGRTNSLRKIIQSDFDLFTTVYPVVLTNPIAADSILPLKQGLFEVVIFDEASQLRIEDTFTSFIRGQYKVIAGDKHQMPPTEFFAAVGTVTSSDEESEVVDFTNEEIDKELASSESLLDYASNLPRKSYSYLDYHYRSQHPLLIEFSNAAFYGGNLISFPEKEAYTPIHFIPIDGRCIEQVNREEVAQVIKLLSEEIRRDSEGRYPSVGIATFNLKQRNEIIDAINEKVAIDEGFAAIIDGIKKKGFFVKNLENIQGDEMDVIIISTTYGRDADGRFFERFGPVNTEKGYKLLNVLVTRAKHRVFVCTSIPKERYDGYELLIKMGGNNKKAILYAYLAYAEAVSAGDVERVKGIIERLTEQTHDTPRMDKLPNQGLTESPFEQEVYELLVESLGDKRVHPQYKIGGFRIDFVVTSDSGRKIAVECDGKGYHSSNEAYAHDMYRQKELEMMGFEVYRIWSTRWWHDHKRELTQLLDFIENRSPLTV
jgi:very-short-patch-repair endonuclease